MLNGVYRPDLACLDLPALVLQSDRGASAPLAITEGEDGGNSNLLATKLLC